MAGGDKSFRSKSNLIRRIAAPASSRRCRANAGTRACSSPSSSVGRIFRRVEKTRNLMNVILIHDPEKVGLRARNTGNGYAGRRRAGRNSICMPRDLFSLGADLSSGRCSPVHFTTSSSIKWAIRTSDQREDYVLSDVPFRAVPPSPLIIKCVLFSAGRLVSRALACVRTRAKLRLARQVRAQSPGKYTVKSIDGPRGSRWKFSNGARRCTYGGRAAREDSPR